MLAPLLCDYDFKEKLHKGENWKLSLSEETSWSIFNAKLRKNSRLWKVPIAKDWKRFLFLCDWRLHSQFQISLEWSETTKSQNAKSTSSTFPQIRMNGSSKNDSKFLFYCDFEFLFIYRITTTPNVMVLTSHNSRHILQIKKEFKQTLLSEFVQSVGRFWTLLKC
jgi:hypothetical protein